MTTTGYGYPDANYPEPSPPLPGGGDSCDNPAPNQYRVSQTICTDQTILGSTTTEFLNVNADSEIFGNSVVKGTETAGSVVVGDSRITPDEIIVTVPVTVENQVVIRGYTKTDNLEVQELEFRAVRLPPFDNYYVLASYIPPSNGNT